jgi:hypothetical protein
VQLKFVVREDADSLVVTANGDTSGLVEIWELREKPIGVHKIFQRSTSSTPPPEPFKTIVSIAQFLCGFIYFCKETEQLFSKVCNKKNLFIFIKEIRLDTPRSFSSL